MVGYMQLSKKKMAIRHPTAAGPRRPIVRPQRRVAKNAYVARMYRGRKNFMRKVEMNRPMVKVARATLRRLEPRESVMSVTSVT